MALVSPTAASLTRDQVRERLTHRDRNIWGVVLQGVLLFTLLFTLLVLFTLLARVFSDAWPVFTERGTAFLTDRIGSDPATIGVRPGLYGSVLIGVGVLIIAIPLGVSASIYLEEYAKESRIERFIVINIRNLAGVPAVIYGVLGLTIFVGWLRPVTNGQTVIAASLTLAVLVLPIVIITSSEAIRAVPQGIREAGYGVGATRWEVTRDHVLPYAAPGILTGTVLALARALGEAAPLIILGAITGLLPSTSLTGRFTAVPMLIFSWAGRPSTGEKIDWPNVAAAAGVVLLALVLFFITLGLNLIGDRFVRRVRHTY